MARTVSSGIDQSQTTVLSGHGLGNNGNQKRVATSFTPTRKYLSGVTIRKNPNGGSPTFDVAISLQADNSGSPSGTDLASVTIPAATWDAISNNTDYFVALAYSLICGNKYWIVFIPSAQGDASNYRTTCRDNIGNNSVSKDYNGSSWANNNWGQLYFKTHYGRAVATTATNATDQSQPNQSGQVVSLGQINTKYVAQTFIPAQSYLSGIKFYKESNIGNFAGDVTVDLVTSTATDPTTNVLATYSYTSAQYNALPTGLNTVPLTTKVIPGHYYAIKFTSSTADNANYGRLQHASAGGYANGSERVSADAVTWNSNGSADMTFYTLYTLRVPAAFRSGLIPNGRFENAPAFTAATNTTARYIDGTAGGSTTQNAFKWALLGSTAGFSAQFDSTVYKTGAYSIKLSHTATGGYVFVLNAMEARDTTPTTRASELIPIKPSTSYTISAWVKGNVTDTGTYPEIGFTWKEYKADFTSAAGAGDKHLTAATFDWTFITQTFTSNASSAFLKIGPYFYNASGDMWCDDLRLQQTSRTAAA